LKKRVPPNNNNKPRKLFKTPAKPSASDDRVPEWLMQAAVISDCHKWQDAGWNFVVAGDQNGMHTSASQAQRAKVTGMTTETDLRYYLGHGVLRMIELKHLDGRLSKEQIARHEQFCTLGHPVEVVYADSEASAVIQCGNLLGGWLADGIAADAKQRPTLQ
jgi:hypothetical protein